MPAAVPICPSVSFNPDSGVASTTDMVLTMVTSSPSRIQVTPRAITTSQGHLAHGTLSIRDGIRLSTALPTELASLTRSLLSIGRTFPAGRSKGPPSPLLTLRYPSLTPPEGDAPFDSARTLSSNRPAATCVRYLDLWSQ